MMFKRFTGLPNPYFRTTLLRNFANKSYDVVVIGAGPGGYVAAIKAAQLGLKTACVESRGSLGGTCLNVGCIPSKVLLNLSHKYHDMKADGKSNGFIFDNLTFDWGQIQKQKDKTVKGQTGGIQGLFRKNKVDYLKGHGKIEGPNTVSVNPSEGTGETVEAKNIIIATGSEPTPFPGIPFDEKVFVSSTGAQSLPKVPETMTIIGAGIIGLELGSVYQLFGTKVHVLEFMDRCVPPMDTELGKLFDKILKKQGLSLQYNTKVTGGKVLPNGKAEVTYEPKEGGASEKRESDVVLVGVGRRAYTQGLGQENVGITTSRLGQVEINDRFQTIVPSIYAIGDCVDGPMLAHKAEEEGIACVELIAGHKGHINYNCIPSVVYTHPEVAWVGKTEDECKAQGLEYTKGTFPMQANSRTAAIIDKAAAMGMIKILSCKKTERILGGHIIGSSAGELIHELVLGMEYGASAEDIARTCHAHPTLSEGVKEAALAASSKAIHF